MESASPPPTHRVALTVAATDKETLLALLGDADPKPGKIYEVLPGVRLGIESHLSKRGWGQPEVVESALTFAAGVSPGTIAGWLAERLKGRRVRLEIEGRPVAAADIAAITDLLSSAHAESTGRRSQK